MEGLFKFCIERNPYDKMVSRYYWKYRGKPSRPSFETFLERTKDVSDIRLYSLEGKVAVDFIGRNSGTRERSDVASLYTPRAREIVSRMFAREIDLFGYTFPG